jgi:hypothetical protein
MQSTWAVLYSDLWPVCFYTIFPHYLKKVRFSEKLLNIKCVFSFTLNFLSETFLILRKDEQDIINVHMYSRKAPVNSCQISMKLKFSKQSFEKYSNIIFHGTPSSGSRVVPRWRRDGRKYMIKLTDAFRNFANAPKMIQEHNIKQLQGTEPIRNWLPLNTRVWKK